MKEVTEWDNNPREMWVWDDDKNERMKFKVLYVMSSKEVEEYDSFYPGYDVYRVIALNDFKNITKYKHCAEIGTQQYMTNQELSWWLRDGVRREMHVKGNDVILGYFNYDIGCENKTPDNIENIEIRENGGEWHEPLVED